ncbi:MAG: hypothetical protein DWQ01_21780 [Planctomycetota bacterium]|nr:MAG: hypothetical protein DWQ01_21780 [Planctomycetota bacterium]
MQTRLAGLMLVLAMLVPGRLGLGLQPLSCQPGQACCCLGAGEELSKSDVFGEWDQGCCCEVQPQLPDAPEPPQPKRLKTEAPEVPDFSDLGEKPALEWLPALGLREIPSSRQPRAPPRPLFLLYASFLC